MATRNNEGSRRLSPTQQSAYHLARVARAGDIDGDIRETMRLHLVEDLGLSDHAASARANQELRRVIPGAVIASLSAAGVSVANIDVLDLGAGLGGMSEELIARGARVIALEPGAAWATLTRRRVERHGGQFQLLEALGESVPLPSNSIDLVVSLQVLEHVEDPAKVLAEAWRVLRPGGHFYLACENYLAFREAHYQVPWFPLLPKRVGGLYLRWLGRSPKFLYEAVTYTTYPGVLRRCRQLGFVRRRDETMLSGLRSKTGAKWAALRVLSLATGGRGLLWLDLLRYSFKFGIYELFRKPDA